MSNIYRVMPDNSLGLVDLFVVAKGKCGAIDMYCETLDPKRQDLLYNAWKDDLVEVEKIGKTMTVDVDLRICRG